MKNARGMAIVYLFLHFYNEQIFLRKLSCALVVKSMTESWRPRLRSNKIRIKNRLVGWLIQLRLLNKIFVHALDSIGIKMALNGFSSLPGKKSDET